MNIFSNDYDGQMIPGDECGPNFLTFVLQLRENPKKSSTRKLTLPGIRPGPAVSEAMTLLLDHNNGHIFNVLHRLNLYAK